MDNLELMQQLPDESINLIYCDVLYNTGKKFKDYDDNLGSPQQAIEWYKPRLIEMIRLLKDTGNICLQCDYRLSPYIQILLNELSLIFQDKIIWKKGETGKGAKGKKILSKDYDEILYYTKSNIFTTNKINKPHDVVSLKEYKYQDKGGYFKIVNLGMYSKLSVDKMKENGEIYTSRFGKEYKKYYLTDMNETCLSDIWMDCHNLYNGENKEMINYDTQKPKALLERIVYMFSNQGDLVADFFVGSGTTCLVAKELNRNYLGCDINQKAIDITYNRLI